MIKPGWLAAGVALAVTVVGVLIARATGSGASDLPLPDCSTKYKAVHFGATRDPKNLRLIVLHSTEGGTAAGAAGWFANPASGGSAHVVIDDTECYRTLADNVIPWGAKGGRANEDGLHVEMTGYAKWSRAEWLQHRATLEKTAAVLQKWSKDYGIPLRMLSAADLKRDGLKARGVTTHAAITEAFKQGDHTDPGKNFPLDELMRLAGGSTAGIA